MAARLSSAIRPVRVSYLVTRRSIRNLKPSLQRLSILPAESRPLQTTSHRHLTTTTRLSSNNNGSPFSSLFSALPNLNLPFPTPGSGPPAPKTLRARRLLPYPPAHLYTIIADIDAYSAFLPNCTHSRVTEWTTPSPLPSPPPPTTTTSTPTATQQPHKNPSSGSVSGPTSPSPARHPALADLTVGWGPFTQTYTSRVYCVPGSVVEAVSGRHAETSIPAATLRAAGYTTAAGDKSKDKELEGGIFESLVTRWTVQPAAAPNPAAASGAQGEWTEVTLSVTFQFANPALGFAVGQLADDKVGEMVEAFEKRAKELDRRERGRGR